MTSLRTGPTAPPRHPDVLEMIDRQDGVLARWQALDAGVTPGRIRTLLRRREWVVAHPGVYLTHTGRATWQQRAWTAVLACWPAALASASALRAIEGPGCRDLDERRILVVVDRDRNPRPPSGVEVRRTDRLATVQWHRYPPRQAYEDAVLMHADDAHDDLEVVARLSQACSGRRTTAARLRAALAAQPRAPRRALLEEVLRDVEDGTCSVLEHAYRHRVEGAHGLPRGALQAPAAGPGGRRIYRDVSYGDHGLVVELDGRMFHDSVQARDRDLERDLDAALGGLATVRLGYGQVMNRPCATAHKIARLLGVPCGPCGSGNRKCGDSLSP